MDLAKFVEEVGQLEKEREVLAVRIGQLETEVLNTQKERDIIAKQLISTSAEYDKVITKVKLLHTLIVDMGTIIGELEGDIKAEDVENKEAKK